ncbi:hypothetical protein HMPREF3188_01008 [Tissierellia bacterium KA00581]|nr:hypothetical protein HMPREF3188_01008 [Tissierellia bacterium KA00581]
MRKQIVVLILTSLLLAGCRKNKSDKEQSDKEQAKKIVREIREKEEKDKELRKKQEKEYKEFIEREKLNKQKKGKELIEQKKSNKQEKEKEEENKIPTKEEFLKQCKTVSNEKRKYLETMIKNIDFTLPDEMSAEYIQYLNMVMIDTKGNTREALKEMIKTKNNAFRENWNNIVESCKKISGKISLQIDNDLAVGILNPLDESDFILIYKGGSLIYNFWK